MVKIIVAVFVSVSVSVILGRKHPFFKSVSYVKYLVTIFPGHNLQAQDRN